MNKNISREILENPKLLEHLMEQSYWLKHLNRSSDSLKIFQKEMKVLYKERVTDRINSAIDGVDMISSVIESIK